MMFDDRVQAVVDFGLPERQARFLVTVMLHAGVCVPRQYARFAGTAYGHTVNEFFDKITLRGYASEWPCQHPRARLHHVHKLRLSRAVGQPHSRYRRPVSVRQVIERLMWLDEIIDNRDLSWLATTDKVEFFRRTLPGLAPELLPHATARRPSRTPRLFPDDLPIGVQADGRVVFPYLVTTAFAKDPFCEFLQRHIHVLHALPSWTVRILAPRWFASCAELERAARFELTMPFAPQTLIDMEWYFKHRQATPDVRARCRSDGEFWEETHRLASPRAGAFTSGFSKRESWCSSSWRCPSSATRWRREPGESNRVCSRVHTSISRLASGRNCARAGLKDRTRARHSLNPSRRRRLGRTR